MRKTMESFLGAFERYLPGEVQYINTIFRVIPIHILLQNYDYVFITHSASVPWNRNTYKIKKQIIQKICSLGEKKIIFFQDEYFNTDLIEDLVNSIDFDCVYSVAPESEWGKIYPNLDKSKFKSYLTGYIDSDDLRKYEDLLNVDRKIDIGYRTAEHNKGMYKLGDLGRLKSEIGLRFLDYSENLSMDIALGRKFLKGNDWFKFLLNCRFTLGAESGSSILDRNGAIQGKIRSIVEDNKDFSYEEIMKEVVDKDNSMNFSAISPRIFEAAILKTGLILVKGQYNNVLKENIHYIPVEKDFSNIKDVIEIAKDEKNRVRMVNSVYNDIVLSKKYTYKSFIEKLMKDNIIEPKFKDYKSCSFWFYINKVHNKLMFITIKILRLIV